ncbi:hypothetical protein [Sediminicoccus sp. KRV36]|uniref:hypothetical protein n=1 Tax=Sediminicoccus sp. KRV36 TaxID=3133721 RepID=UPI0020104481|nr:hypothetical protein [Sediminicoccus rosea]UPY39434.1 hypothetical protein LHU95_07890 [Sediminicoccus rosea]
MLEWPPEAPRLRFLVTTGLNGETLYDPAQDIAFIGAAPALVLAVLRADEPNRGLPDQPAHPQADRGGLRLDQAIGRAAPEQAPRDRAARCEIFAGRHRLQADPAGFRRSASSWRKAGAGCCASSPWNN